MNGLEFDFVTLDQDPGVQRARLSTSAISAHALGRQTGQEATNRYGQMLRSLAKFTIKDGKAGTMALPPLLLSTRRPFEFSAALITNGIETGDVEIVDSKDVSYSVPLVSASDATTRLWCIGTRATKMTSRGVKLTPYLRPSTSGDFKLSDCDPGYPEFRLPSVGDRPVRPGDLMRERWTVPIGSDGTLTRDINVPSIRVFVELYIDKYMAKNGRGITHLNMAISNVDSRLGVMDEFFHPVAFVPDVLDSKDVVDEFIRQVREMDATLSGAIAVKRGDFNFASPIAPTGKAARDARGPWADVGAASAADPHYSVTSILSRPDPAKGRHSPVADPAAAPLAGAHAEETIYINPKLTLSFMPADLAQVYTNCRHGGNSSYIACPSCNATRFRWLDTEQDVMRHDIARSRDWMEVCQNQAELQSRLSHTKGTTARTYRNLYGIMKKAPITPFMDGLEFDEHKQTFPDLDHLFPMGLFKAMILECICEVDTHKPPVGEKYNLRVLFCRFPWPHGHRRFQWDPTRPVGAGVTMDMYKALAFACVTLLKRWVALRLITADTYNLFVEGWMLYTRLASSRGLSRAEANTLEADGLSWIENCKNDDRLVDAINRPNGHAFIELLQKELYWLQNSLFVRTSAWERQHQLGQRAHSKTVDKGRWTVGYLSRLYAVRHLLCGGTWGERNEYKAGPGLLSLTDFREGRKHRIHPLMTAISPLMRHIDHSSGPVHSLSQSDGRRTDPASDTWLPGPAAWDSNGHRRAEKPTGSLANAIQAWYTDARIDGFDTGDAVINMAARNVVIRYPRYVYMNDSRTLRNKRIYVGDDVSCWWVDDNAPHASPSGRGPFLNFARVEAFITISIKATAATSRKQTKSVTLFLPRWYDKAEDLKQDSKVRARVSPLADVDDPFLNKRHRVRHTVRCKLSDADALKCSRICMLQSKVMAVHDCKWVHARSAPGTRRRPDDRCTLEFTDPNYPDGIKHSKHNMFYEIFDRVAGYIAPTTPYIPPI